MNRRIAIISEHAAPTGIQGGVDNGGQNVYVCHIAKNLARLGYLVDVFTRKDSPSLPEVCYWEDGIRLIFVPAGPASFVRKEDLLPHMEEFLNFMLRFYKNNPPHLVHANFWMSGLVALGLKEHLGLPFAITFHALGRVRLIHQRETDEFPAKRLEIEDRIVANADLIIAECPQDEEDLATLYNADPRKIVIVPCGFDPEELHPLPKSEAREIICIGEEEKIVLHLGRIVPRKGIDTAIRGFAHMQRKSKISAKLVIVGGDADTPDVTLTPEIGRLQNIAAEEGVLDSIVFTGRRNRNSIKYYYNAADVFVTVPWYEPFGITPVEAMACGTPVIGSEVGGIKYTVRPGETGLLVPPKDPIALGDNLAMLLFNKELLKSFSEQAVLRANSFFTWENIGTSLATVFERVIANSPVHRIRRKAIIATKQIPSPMGRLESTRTKRLSRRSSPASVGITKSQSGDLVSETKLSS